MPIDLFRLTVQARSKTRFQALSEEELPWMLEGAVRIFYGPICGLPSEVYFNEVCGVIVVHGQGLYRGLRIYANIDDLVVDVFGGLEHWPEHLRLHPRYERFPHDIVDHFQEFIGF